MPDLGSMALAAGGMLLGYGGQAAANAANVKLSREQMAFQERMSSTAHQREVADLLKAGLNPMLSTRHGGASSPAGAAPRIESAVGAGVHSGLAASRMKAEIEHLSASADRERSQAGLARAQHFTEDFMRNYAATELNERAGLHAAHRDVAILDRDTKRELLPLVAKHMSADIASRLATALSSRSHAALMDAETVLKRFQENEFRNMSEAQQTWWMREIAPFLASAGQAGRVVSSIATPVAGAAVARQMKRALPRSEFARYVDKVNRSREF